MLIWNDHLISKYLWMEKKFTSLMIMIKIMTKVWFLGKMTLLWSPFSTHKEENCTEDLCSVQRGGIQLQLWYNDQPRQSDANPRNLGLNEFISGIPKKASSGVAEKVKAHCLSVSDINTTPAEVDIVGYDNGCQFQQCWCSSTFYNPILKLIIESWLGWVIYTRAGQFFMVIFYFVYWSNIKVFKWVWNWNFVIGWSSE